MKSETNDGCVGVVFFFFNDTATTEIYTLSLHDALPIFFRGQELLSVGRQDPYARTHPLTNDRIRTLRALEIGRAHVWTPVTRPDLVCRLLLEKKKPHTHPHPPL